MMQVINDDYVTMEESFHLSLEKVSKNRIVECLVRVSGSHMRILCNGR